MRLTSAFARSSALRSTTFPSLGFCAAAGNQEGALPLWAALVVVVVVPLLGGGGGGTEDGGEAADGSPEREVLDGCSDGGGVLEEDAQ